MKPNSWKNVAASLTFACAAAVGLRAADAAELTWAFAGDSQSLDPYALSEVFTLGFQSNFYEPLVRRNADLQLEPALAESWKMLDDTRWRFNLRKGVTFHNGEPFTADDVVFSLERARSPSSDVKAKVRSIKSIEKIDSHTIEIVTEGPSPTLLSEVSDWFIVSQKWAVANNAVAPADVRKGQENFATTHENGTGPFRVESRQPDVKTVFKAFDKWWDKKEHNLDTVTFTPIAADATRVAALLSGKVDLILPVPLQDVPRLKASSDVKVLQGPETRVMYFGFDVSRDKLLYSDVTDRNPFKDIRVRKAVSLAIDRNAIVSRVMEGAAHLTGSIIAPGVEGYDPALAAPLPTNLDEAKALLAEAGYPNGFSVTLDCPNDRYVNDEKVCLAVSAMLARAGIKAKVAAITKTRYFGKILDRDTSFYYMGWTPPTYDAHNILFDMIGTPEQGGQGKWNMGNYSNPKVDALQKEIASTMDQAKRRKMISDAFRLVKDDYGFIPIFQQVNVWGMRANVAAVQRADNRFEFRWVTVK